MRVPHLVTLGDLSVQQINAIITHAAFLKSISKPWLAPAPGAGKIKGTEKLRLPSQSLFNKSIALVFSKRSTRTRIAAETSTFLLGGRALFLGKEDIHLGVNEPLRDTARVIGGMCQGIFARVGAHKEVVDLARYSPVPVINALSSQFHPTQILADLLTLHEHAHMFGKPADVDKVDSKPKKQKKRLDLSRLRPLTIAYVGDPNNILNDMLLTYPRQLTMLSLYPTETTEAADTWARVKALGCDSDFLDGISFHVDPAEAVQGADVVVTDTWISMGQESERAERLKAFDGYRVTEALCSNAFPQWRFMHCLPRHEEEVDDNVFYGPRSLVFPEADNRKWTIMALFDLIFGKWSIDLLPTAPRSDIDVETETEVNGTAGTDAV
ncbi:ornithine carbamoyltransferase 1 [Fistulina hepatica ATCC 64428]|uniref:ornithine carbamoyltransferase n=1 Tax=Fistulina hepatica ATCC 64428 TaxID=1128425 RepID=A0A0D7A098_9AGAR|nr:ornithine carbamoyltransferase 1 [Fistulina hepatica ATCC 64428]